MNKTQYGFSQSQEEYVKEFLAHAGWSDISLSSDVKREIFGLISGEEGGAFHADTEFCEWSPLSVSHSNRSKYLAPRIEEILSAELRKGNVKRLIELCDLWPNGKAFALVLTHDIDSIRRFPWKEQARKQISATGISFRTRLGLAKATIMYAFGSLACRLGQTAEYDLADFMKLEQSYGFHSTMYWIVNGPKATHVNDGTYSLADKMKFDGRWVGAKDVIRQIASDGWEIALHGSIGTATDQHRLIGEKRLLESALGKNILSTRQHYLRFDIRKTPAIHEAAGFQTDSTIGSNILPSYRTGTGLPHYLYDPKNNRPRAVLEVPLVIQDNALALACRDDEQKMIDTAIEFLEKTAMHNSVITILWHNNYLPTTKMFRVYRALLSRAKELNAWGCAVGELARRVEQRTEALATEY